MADKKGITKLDEKLISMNIVPGSFLGDFPLVHRKMNSIIKKTGAILSDEVFETGNAALRKWLLLLNSQGASQEKLTAYLRCGLAHLSYDFIESQFHQIGIDDLVSRTLVSFKGRNLHTSFFKPPAEPIKLPTKKNTAASGKVTAIKKTVKAPVKKVIAKKAPAKKALAKKAATQKDTVKKTPDKKTIVKKAPAKKSMVKKPIVKNAKAPVKKATVKKATVKKTGKVTPKKT